MVEAAAALGDPTTNCIRSKTKDDEVREGWPPFPALAPLLPSPFEVVLVDTNPERDGNQPKTSVYLPTRTRRAQIESTPLAEIETPAVVAEAGVKLPNRAAVKKVREMQK